MRKQSELEAHLVAERLDRELTVVVDGKKFKALSIIRVLHCGWESDCEAWLVDDEGEMKLVMTNHGDTYFANKSELVEKIEEYEGALAESKAVLAKL